MKSQKSVLFKNLGTLLAFSLVLAVSTALSAAAEYPAKPIRLIIPFAPGGSVDVVGRMIGAQLGQRLGKQVVPDNRAGAGGVVGTEIAAHSEPDGHILLITSAAHSFNPLMFKVPYDPVKSFVPVAKLATGPNALIIHPSLPANSVKDLITLAKQKPGNLNFAASGMGSFAHLASELFRMLSDIDIRIVQFKGGGPAIIDVMGGHSQAVIPSLIMCMPHIRSGKLVLTTRS